MHVPERTSRYRTVARSTAIAAFALVIAAPAALAAPPTHAPAVSIEVLVPGGDYCEHDVVLTNPTFRSHDTDFAALPDGTVRFRERGMASSRATDVATDAFIESKGGAAIVYRFAADGSVIAVGTGLLFAWYLPGDDSELGAGLFLVNGRVREVYDTDGTFVSSTFSGSAIDVCEALAG